MKALHTLLFSVTLISLYAQSITDPNLPAEGKVMNLIKLMILLLLAMQVHGISRR